MYIRYAESARVNWMRNFATYIDPEHKKEWTELRSSTGIGLILRTMTTEYKFVRTKPISLRHHREATR